MGSPSENDLTPSEMKDWLRQEVLELNKAFELRVKDATDFVTAYALGNIDAGEANHRWTQYNARWGEPFRYGVSISEGSSNEEILATLDHSMNETKKQIVEASLKRTDPKRQGRSR